MPPPKRSLLEQSSEQRAVLPRRRLLPPAHALRRAEEYFDMYPLDRIQLPKPSAQTDAHPAPAYRSAKRNRTR